MPMNARKTPEMTVSQMVDDPKVDIRIADPDWEGRFDNLTETVMRALTAAANHSRAGKVDLLLTHDAEIHDLNKNWRDKDNPTDVLSFPSDGSAFETGFLGDIAISLGVMSRDAEDMKKTLGDHFSHLLVHGYLHLLGYDHQLEDEAAEMEAMEIKILADLGISNPYSLQVEE